MSTAIASPLDRAALRDAVAWFLASRALLLLVGVLTVETIDAEVEAVYGGGWADIFCRWDCGWYQTIVGRGYVPIDESGQSNLAFFPLLPLVVAGISKLTGMAPLAAGLLFANACFLVALCYVHAYARLLGSGERAATLAVALLAFVPHSFVFSSFYTESPFVLLLAAAMYHLRRGHFLVAGICAAALSATRAAGIFFMLFVVAWIVRVHGIDALLRPWRRPELFVPVVLAPLGLFLFWAYCFALAGDAFAMSSTVEQGWSWRAGAPWTNLWSHLRYDIVTRFWTISSLAIASLCVLLWRRRMWEELVLCAAVFLLLWSGQVPNSLLRYSMVLFPLWIVLGQSLSRRPVAAAFVLAAFAALNAFLMVAWTLGKPITI
jgi:hypothetical protein